MTLAGQRSDGREERHGRRSQRRLIARTNLGGPAIQRNVHHVTDVPPMISYAQNLEDVVLQRALRAPVGFYVDVGAASPSIASVTRHFYDHGWSGINIEPLPEYVAELRVARPRDWTVRAVAGASPRTGQLSRGRIRSRSLDLRPPSSRGAFDRGSPDRRAPGRDGDPQRDYSSWPNRRRSTS